MFSFLFFSFVLFSICPTTSFDLQKGAELGPGNGVVFVYYYSKWNPPYIYFNGGNGWVKQPGTQMVPSTNSSFPASEWWQIGLAYNQLTWVFDDDHGHWDHRSDGGNFQVNLPGIYSAKDGVLSTWATFNKACAGNPSCSGNGKCLSNYTCECKPGYWGGSCAGVCPGGPQNTCYGHGVCDDGANGSGTCKCFPHWASCPGKEVCSTSTSNSSTDCGQCGAICKPDPAHGIKSAKCVDGKCIETCSDGFILCPTGCFKGSTCPKPPLPGCQTFDLNHCSGNNIDTPTHFEASRWWTPRPGDSHYRDSYQDYWRLVGHTHVVYSSDRTAAQVEVVLIHSNTTGVNFTYYFDGQAQTSPTKKFDSSYIATLHVTVSGSDGSRLVLSPVDFVWTAPPVHKQGDFRNGQKGAIVEMFGWPHSEIEKECQAVSKMGYLGVKLFPVQEQVMSDQPFNNILNPWYFMYQPVSYKLQGRMGSRDQLRSMIVTCRKYGVRVYADAVINHMVGGGNDANPSHRNFHGACTYWPNKNSSNPDQSPFYTQDFAYTFNNHTGQPPSQEFPAVPWGPLDFHCERPLNSWNSPLDLNAGWLTGLVDLNTERENVQERLGDYLTDLLGIGFSGFRIDAAKHIKPDDMVAIFSKLKRNMGGTLPDDFITWWEILLGGEAEMLMCNKNSGYNYGAYLTDAFQAAGFSSDDINKIKIWNSGYPKEPDANCDTITKWRNAVQNDDADQQNPGSTSRDMGNQGCVLIKDCSSIEEHRQFEIKLFTNPNGAPDNDNDYPIRMVLSSFYWGQGTAEGIPDGKSNCSRCTITCEGCKTMYTTTAFDPNSCGYDPNPGYTRVHRDKQIILAMRSWVHLDTHVSNEDIGLPASCT